MASPETGSMARFARLAVLAWWFISTGGYGIKTAIGPFGSQEQCQKVRAATVNGYWQSECWWDGKP